VVGRRYGGIEVRITDDPGDDVPEDVPAEVVAQAKAAFAQRTDAETATLVWDSLVDEDASPADHRLRFEHPDVQVDVRISAAGDTSDLDGRARRAAPIRVELQSDDGEVIGTSAVTDGAFSFVQISHRVVRLCLVGSPETTVVRTDWFRI
jgi:hypothetical protein